MPRNRKRSSSQPDWTAITLLVRAIRGEAATTPAEIVRAGLKFKVHMAHDTVVRALDGNKDLAREVMEVFRQKLADKRNRRNKARAKRGLSPSSYARRQQEKREQYEATQRIRRWDAERAKAISVVQKRSSAAVKVAAENTGSESRTGATPESPGEG